MDWMTQIGVDFLLGFSLVCLVFLFALNHTRASFFLCLAAVLSGGGAVYCLATWNATPGLSKGEVAPIHAIYISPDVTENGGGTTIFVLSLKGEKEGRVTSNDKDFKVPPRDLKVGDWLTRTERGIEVLRYPLLPTGDLGLSPAGDFK